VPKQRKNEDFYIPLTKFFAMFTSKVIKI